MCTQRGLRRASTVVEEIYTWMGNGLEIYTWMGKCCSGWENAGGQKNGKD
jgi:hypothetical protein